MKTILTALLISVFSLSSALTVKSTAYNADVSQTDSTPFITATGARVGAGQAALSRDLLSRIPYGSVIRLTSVRGPGCGGYATGNLTVTDTMHPRKRNQVDVFMWSKASALKWGSCQAELKIVRLARR